jgi:hypothetical protein
MLKIKLPVPRWLARWLMPDLYRRSQVTGESETTHGASQGPRIEISLIDLEVKNRDYGDR